MPGRYRPDHRLPGEPSLPRAPGGARGPHVVPGPHVPLGPYTQKRDFRLTPEPPGGGPLGGPLGGPPGPPPAPFPRFVVQEHHARRLHWDLRLEHGGVLKSWAVPKGIPEQPGEKRLAVKVEDHPLEYLEFEGTIPPGNYGAGQVTIWDRGLYAPAAMTDRKVTFAARGRRLDGAYKLVRMEGDDWLLTKLAEDRPHGSGR